MEDKLLEKKLKDFKKIVKEFIQFRKSSIEEVHKLRVSCRELCSLLSIDDFFYYRLKKVMKLSNKIRDIDVFYEFYLDSLPKKYIRKLNLQTIINSTDKVRNKKIDKLYLYLESLVIPNNLEFISKKPIAFFASKGRLTLLNQEELHKYRIYIKKILYNEKNSFPINKVRVNTLKQIKDILGSINDNSNGLKRLSSYEIEGKLFKEIELFTHKENAKLFKVFIKFNGDKLV